MSGLAVGAPQSYTVFSDDDLAAGAPPRGPKVAVLVTHGMGQQSKFDTLDQMAEGLAHDANMIARNVRIGELSFSRIELELKRGEETREVHLYEAYWAPITEGVVKMQDVIGFLFSTAWNGILNARVPFHRWLFGSYPSVLGKKPGRRTTKFLLIGLAVLLSLIFMNTIVMAVGSANVTATLTGGQKSWLKDPKTVDDLTLAALLFCAVAVAFYGTMKAASRQRHLPGAVPLVSKMSFFYFFAVTAATVMTALVMLASIGFHRMNVDPRVTRLMVFGVPILSYEWTERAIAFTFLLAAATLLLWAASICAVAGIRRGASGRAWSALTAILLILAAPSLIYTAGAEGSDSVFSFAERAAAFVGASLAPLRPLFDLVAAGSRRWLIVWAALFGLSAVVRRFLIQYLGDVAAYVTPQKLDRFNDIRQRIKDCAGKVADAIYRAREGDGLMYDNVVVIGASLGSVISYDTLNRMLNADGYSGGRLQVAARTPSLITFGSPLDKVAFLFASNVQRVGQPVRAALAATVQPLIAFTDVREKIAWTNVYSPVDIISGDLNFYDLKQPLPFHSVVNVIDYDAVTPLAAHNEYWDNPLVWSITRDAVFGE
jgi:hypothetical protein